MNNNLNTIELLDKNIGASRECFDRFTNCFYNNDLSLKAGLDTKRLKQRLGRLNKYSYNLAKVEIQVEILVLEKVIHHIEQGMFFLKFMESKRNWYLG
jgi:hypothetical protein